MKAYEAVCYSSGVLQAQLETSSTLTLNPTEKIPSQLLFSHAAKFDNSQCPLLRIWSQAAPLRLVICSGVLLKPAALRATSLPQTSITFVSSSKFSSEVKKKLALQRNVSAGQIIRAHCSTIKPPQMPQRQRRLVGISADNLSLNNFF